MARPERAAATVVERELAVLVVGAAGDGVHVDLIEIVLAGVLDRNAGFVSVAALHERRGVREGVNRPRRGRWIRTTVQPAEVLHVDRRNLVLELLPDREYIRVVDAPAGSAVQASLGVHADEHLVERVRVVEVVDQVALDGAGPGEGLRPIRPFPFGASQSEGSAERIDGLPVRSLKTEHDLVAVVQPVVEPDAVLPLILRVLAVENRIGRALLEARRRLGIQLHQPGPIR